MLSVFGLEYMIIVVVILLSDNNGISVVIHVNLRVPCILSIRDVVRKLMMD